MQGMAKATKNFAGREENKAVFRHMIKRIDMYTSVA